MNLLLLQRKTSSLRLDKKDSRTVHLREVLRVKDGDEIDLAVRNGPRGKGVVELQGDGDLQLRIEWQPQHAPDYYPISLIVAISRPQTCRKILDQATSLGVRSFSFFEADKGESSYRQSTLWSSEEWKEKIEQGVAQAFVSYAPNCDLYESLEQALKANENSSGGFSRIALDNYEADASLTASSKGVDESACLCVGPERGWSERERNLLRQSNYRLHHLGPRVLRVETAVIAALGLLASPFWEDGELGTGE